MHSASARAATSTTVFNNVINIPTELTINRLILSKLSRSTSTSSLYWVNENTNTIESREISNIESLISLNAERTNTIFIRNIIFIVNLYRTIRLKLQRDLMYNSELVTSPAPITSIHLTELIDNKLLTNTKYENSQRWNKYI